MQKQPISEVLSLLDAGKFDNFAGRELQALINTIAERIDEGGTNKGEITIKIAVKVTGSGVVQLSPSLTAKEPSAPHQMQILWTNKEGVLVAENPKQQNLPFRKPTLITEEGVG